jgi:trehalose 2-sulfotransferase
MPSRSPPLNWSTGSPASRTPNGRCYNCLMRASAASARRSQPSLSCVVASIPRTGSSLLCRGLAETGIVGQPDDYIAPLVYRSFAAQWGYGPEYEPATTRVERAMLHTATPNGVFALQAHWHDFALLLRTIQNTEGAAEILDHIDRLLESPHYVHISRRDTAAQALSYYRAIYLGEVNVRPDVPPDPAGRGPEQVNLEQVRWLEDMLIDWDAQWQAYFARCDVQPLEVYYEDIVGNYGETVERVLDYLGLASSSAVVDLGVTDSSLESDWTQRWLDEYRSERGRLVPQPPDASWSRRDQIFEVTHSTEPVGLIGSGGSSGSTSGSEQEVVYSCVVDSPAFLVYQSLIWVLTLTRLAGLDPEQLVVHAVEGTDPDHLERLRSLGVRVEPVAGFDERNVYANKLRQLTAGALVDASAAVISDCDIAFVQDITPFTGGMVIRGRPVGAGVPTFMGWRRLIETAGLTRELRLGRAAGGRLVWTCAQNLNGGLLVIPRPFQDQLAEAWPRWFKWLLDHREELAADVNRFAGQVSFGLALIELDLPIGTIPVTTNFPWSGAESTFTDSMPLFGLHYHSRLTPTGRLMEPGVPAVDAAVAKVNALLDEPASRDVLEVALHNWQASLDPPSTQTNKLKRRWLTPSR